MATNFPTSLDALTNPTGSSSLTSPDHASQHADANDAIEALQAKVGVDSSAVITSLDYKIRNLNASELVSGTVPSARISGSYSGITGLGTLSSLTSSGTITGRVITGDDTNAPAISLKGWASDTGWASVESNLGYLLLGSTVYNDAIYLRSNNWYTNVRIGANGQNTLTAGYNTSYNQYSVTIDGLAFCNGWWRSTGATGWYNETYNGGIYMDDSTTVKVYGGKSFYVPGYITSNGNVQANGSLVSLGALLTYGSGIAYYGATVGGGSPNQIGFRWTNPNVNCTVDNVISAVAATFSDRRIKTNIQTLSNGMELIRGLRSVTYNPLDVVGFDEETFEPIIGDMDPYDERIGFVADEIQQVYPNAINAEGNRLKSIDSVQILSMAVSAIQNLDERVKQLEGL
jgi:hypothetical protein